MRDQNFSTTDKVVVSDCHRFKVVCWSAIIVGALVATGLSFLINLFNVGIGLAVVDSTDAGVATVVIGGLIGMAVGGIVTMYVAGWVAGYLAKPMGNHHVGVLHGFAAWCLALVLALMLVGGNTGVVTLNTQLLASNVSPQPTVHVSTNDATSSTPAVVTAKNAKGQPTSVSVNAEKAANTVGIGALVAFLIFFLGAVASCFGGYMGACCRSKCCEGSCDVNDVNNVKRNV